MFSCHEALRHRANMSVSKLFDSNGDVHGALEELTVVNAYQLPIVASLLANKNGFVWLAGAFRGY